MIIEIHPEIKSMPVSCEQCARLFCPRCDTKLTVRPIDCLLAEMPSREEVRKIISKHANNWESNVDEVLDKLGFKEE
jgi:16S rRNA U1498 N3-methylase RsmE